MSEPRNIENTSEDKGVSSHSHTCNFCGNTEDLHHADPSNTASSHLDGNPEACASFVSGASPTTPSPTDASISTPSTPSSTDLTSGGVNWTPHIPDPLNLKDTVPQAIKFITHDVPVTVNYLWNVIGAARAEHPHEELEMPPDSAPQLPSKRGKTDDGPESKRVAREAGEASSDSLDTEIVVVPADTQTVETDASSSQNVNASKTDDVPGSSGSTSTENISRSEVPLQKVTVEETPVNASDNPEVNETTSKAKGKESAGSGLDAIPEETSFSLGKDSTISFTKSPEESESLDTSRVHIQDVEAAAVPVAGTSKGILSKVTGFIKGSSHIIEDIKSGNISSILDIPSEVLSTNPARPNNDNSTERTPLIRPPPSGTDPTDPAGVFTRLATSIYNSLPEDSTVKTIAKVTTLVAGGSASAVCAGIYASGQPVGPTLKKWFKTAVDWTFRWITGGDHNGDDPDDAGNDTSTTTMSPFTDVFEQFLMPDSSTDAIVHLTRNGTDYFYPY